MTKVFFTTNDLEIYFSNVYKILLIYLVIHLDGSPPTRYGIRLDGDCTIGQLKTQLSTLSSLSIEQIGFFDIVASSCIRRNILMDNDQTKIKQINARELLAYELPIVVKSQTVNDETHPVKCVMPFIKAMHRRLERQERYLSPMARHKIVFFGQPMLVPYSLDKNITNEDVYQIVFKQLQRLLRKNNDSVYQTNHNNFHWDTSSKERYPFTLKYITEDGKRCSICPWNR